MPWYLGSGNNVLPDTSTSSSSGHSVDSPIQCEYTQRSPESVSAYQALEPQNFTSHHFFLDQAMNLQTRGISFCT